jgi:hypothetical protein
MGWARYVERMGRRGRIYNIGGKPEGKTPPLGRSICRWINIKMNLREIG